MAGVYEKAVDRESAFEKLKGAPAANAPVQQTGGAPVGGAPAGAPDAGGGMFDGLKGVLFGTTGPRGAHHEGLAEVAARSAIRAIGSTAGREIIRGVLGSLMGGSKRR